MAKVPSLRSEDSMFRMLESISERQDQLLSRLEEMAEQVSLNSSKTPRFPAQLNTVRSMAAGGMASVRNAPPKPPPKAVPPKRPQAKKVESAPVVKPGILGAIQTRVVYADSLARGTLHTVLSIAACLEYITITSAIVYATDDSPFILAFCWILFLGTTLLQFAEMALNMNTAIHRNHWEIVDNVQQSRKQYLKGWFWWDLFVTIPWDLFALASQSDSIVEAMSLKSGVTAFSVLAFIRLLHVVRVSKYFKRRNPILDPPRWVNFLYMMMTGTLLIHTLAVIWMLMATKEEQKIGVENSGDEGFAYQYISGLNWAFQSFVHGKSDAYGHHTKTVVYGLLVKITGFLVIAMIEAKLAEFFVNHDPFHGLARQRQQQLASLIIHNGVPWDVQKNIMSIYPSLLQANMRDYYNIMNDLPPFLSAQISKYIKMRLISAVPMFAQTSEGCREALATVLGEDMLAPGFDIVTRGDVATSMYFISNGMVEVLILNPEGEEICLTTLKEGSWFGEIALLQDTKRTASVRAATAVKVFRLEKADFNVLAEEFPELRAKIQEVANARMKQMAKNDDKNAPSVKGSVKNDAHKASGGEPKKDDDEKGNTSQTSQSVASEPITGDSHDQPDKQAFLSSDYSPVQKITEVIPTDPTPRPNMPPPVPPAASAYTVPGDQNDERTSCSLSDSDTEEVILEDDRQTPVSPSNRNGKSLNPIITTSDIGDLIELPGEASRSTILPSFDSSSTGLQQQQLQQFQTQSSLPHQTSMQHQPQNPRDVRLRASLHPSRRANPEASFHGDTPSDAIPLPHAFPPQRRVSIAHTDTDRRSESVCSSSVSILNPANTTINNGNTGNTEGQQSSSTSSPRHPLPSPSSGRPGLAGRRISEKRAWGE